MSYFYLFIAIVGEILGTNLLKLSDGFTKLFQPFLPYLAMAFVSISSH